MRFHRVWYSLGACLLFVGCGGGEPAGPSEAGGGGGQYQAGGAGGSTGRGGEPGLAGGGGKGGATAPGGAGGSGGASGGSAGDGGGTAGAAGNSARGGSGGRGAAGDGGSTGGSGGAAAAGRGGSAGGAGAGGSAGTAGSSSSDGGVRDGAAGTSGGDGGVYQPCPTDGTACKVMPLGDSITYGVGDEGNGGYRGPLFAAAIAAQRQITFTGSLSNGPSTVSGQTFPKKNEGHSGWGIVQVNPNSGGQGGLVKVIPTPGFSSSSGGTPNIVLLHIGTNDSGSLTATQMISDLRELLDKVISNAPNASILVAQIIPLGYGTNDVIKAYNQAIPGVVQERAAAGKHIALVDMYTGFNAATMLGADKIHPNTAGYKFMADRWYAAIGPLLPASP
jgi:hypothetical protein